jgi:hypothetical protein
MPNISCKRVLKGKIREGIKKGAVTEWKLETQSFS